MVDVVMKGKMISTPRAAVNIYRLAPPRVTEASVRELARSFGLNAEGKAGVLKSDENKLTYSEGPMELMVHRASGGLRFRDRHRWQRDADGQSDFKIEDAAASRLAQDLAAKLKLARSGDYQFFKAARLKVGEADREGREARERTIDVAVALQRLIGKVPVDGPGGKIVVYLDRSKQPTGFERIWRETAGIFRRGGELRPPSAALDDIKKAWESVSGLIEVEEIRFGYFEEGFRAKQQYLQPAYIVIGVIRSPDGQMRRRVVYVAPALAKPVGQLTPPLRRKTPQATRPGGR
jgi:hypothetical protein